MARAPKTTETGKEKPAETTTTETEATPANTGNEGPKGSDDEVKDPDGNVPDPNQPAPDGATTESTEDPEIRDLKAENASLHAKLNQANDLAAQHEERVRVLEHEAAEAAQAPNPLRGELDAALAKLDEVTAERDELLNAPPAEDLEDRPELEAVEGRERIARGYLLGVVLGMPENYRLNGMAAKLDELEQFVAEFEGDDRYVAVELIKGIAKARPNDIPSGRYMNDVRKAFAILDGENEESVSVISARDEQNDAANRLALVVGSNPIPAGYVEGRTDGHGMPVLDGNADQNKAANRLYANT